MPHTIPVPPCPRCRGDMYDNRDSKKNPKSPDFRCKDKACVDDKGFVTGLWEKDIAKAAPAPARAAAPAREAYSAGPHIPAIDGPSKLDDLFSLYAACFQNAYSLAERTFAADATHSGVAAMAATTFIAAKERGIGA